MIWILLYLWGCVTSYRKGKRVWKGDSNSWTFEDREVVVLISVVSWIGYIIFSSTNNSDKEAKW